MPGQAAVLGMMEFVDGIAKQGVSREGSGEFLALKLIEKCVRRVAGIWLLRKRYGF